MVRKATGEVLERAGKRGTAFVLRFRAYGKRQFVTVGNSADGWTRERAQLELQNVMADVRRGIWQAPTRAPVVEPPIDPTFHEFASEWFAAKKPELRPNTRAAYEIEITVHLLPFFARHRLSQITVQEVDRYRQHKVREADRRRAEITRRERERQEAADQGKSAPRYAARVQPLAAATISKTITRLGQILEDACEYWPELMPRNPAKGKRRRLKAERNTRTHLDRADHIEVLLAAAGELDYRARADRRHVARRVIVAMLVFGGLRISELCALRWRDVDLVAGTIRVGEAKTDAGVRVVDMRPALRTELIAWSTLAPRHGSGDYVFATAQGGAPSKDNLRNRVIATAIRKADAMREAEGLAPLPPGLTPHGLRHTYASILIALGKDPRYVMAQIGHTDPAFTLRLYTHQMYQEEGERERLALLVNGPAESADVTALNDTPVKP